MWEGAYTEMGGGRGGVGDTRPTEAYSMHIQLPAVELCTFRGQNVGQHLSITITINLHTTEA